MRETLQGLAVIHEKMVFCKDVEMKWIATGMKLVLWIFSGLPYRRIRSLDRRIRPSRIQIGHDTYPDTSPMH